MKLHYNLLWTLRRRGGRDIAGTFGLYFILISYLFVSDFFLLQIIYTSQIMF